MAQTEVLEDNATLRDNRNQKSEMSFGGKELGPRKLNEKYSLPESYQILIDKPLPHLNTSNAKAFEVIDRKQKAYIYAVILPNNLPIRFGTLQKLRKVFHFTLSNIIDSGFTDAGGGAFGNFAIICERPAGEQLKDYIKTVERGIKEDGSKDYFLSEVFITKNIVEPVNEMLKSLAEEEVSHGCINHNTVYIEVEGDFVKTKVSEAVSEPCGLSQLPQFETIPRAQATPLGKGENTLKDDYFSLGVLIFYCMYGEFPDLRNDLKGFISRRLTIGSYSTYLGNIEVSSRMVDILRGLLNDNPDERWGYEEVSEWIRNKRFNLIRPSFRKESVRSYAIDDEKHFTRRAVANHYANNWDEASADIRSKKILKWLELSVGKQNLADEIASIIVSTGGDKSRSRKDDDELIAKSLILLDPIAPIRYRNLSAHVDGLGVVLANAWANRSQAEIQELRDVFSLNLPDYKVVKDIYTDRSSERWLLQRLNTFINIDSYGFGIERCLYDLNPGLPCQSQLAGNQFIVDLSHLIHYLNENAGRLSEFEPVDRHIAAFMAARLELSQPIELTIPGLVMNKKLKEKMIKLMLLYYSQKRTTVSRLNNLTEWVVNDMGEELKAGINGKTLLEDFSKDLAKAGKSGSISAILEVITSGGYFTKNRMGLSEARKEYANYANASRIYTKSLENAKKYKTFYLTGLYLAKVISILVFVLVVSAVSL